MWQEGIDSMRFDYRKGVVFGVSESRYETQILELPQRINQAKSVAIKQ